MADGHVGNDGVRQRWGVGDGQTALAWWDETPSGGDVVGLDERLAALARRVTQDVVKDGRPAARIAVKVRFAPFITQTRSITLAAPTYDADVIEQAALATLDRFEHTRPVRLLGVRAEFGDTK